MGLGAAGQNVPTVFELGGTQKWVSEGGPSGQIMMEEISEYSTDALGN